MPFHVPLVSSLTSHTAWLPHIANRAGHDLLPAWAGRPHSKRHSVVQRPSRAHPGGERHFVAKRACGDPTKGMTICCRCAVSNTRSARIVTAGARDLLAELAAQTAASLDHAASRTSRVKGEVAVWLRTGSPHGGRTSGHGVPAPVIIGDGNDVVAADDFGFFPPRRST